MRINKEVLIFEGDKEKLEKLGCVVEVIGGNDDMGIYMVDICIPQELDDAYNERRNNDENRYKDKRTNGV